MKVGLNRRLYFLLYLPILVPVYNWRSENNESYIKKNFLKSFERQSISGRKVNFLLT